MAVKRYLVSGGLGYAGAWVTEHLARQGHEVFVLSRGTDKPDLGVPYTLVQADVQQQAAQELAAALPECLDGIAHAASYNEMFEPGYPRKALLVNSLGTRNLLEALVLQAREQATPLPLFLYFSTFHVYGKSSGVITESTPPAPLADYALTHLFAEEYCRMFARTEGLPCIIARLTNGYGAPKSTPCSKWYLLLNDLCKTAFTTGKLVLRSTPAILRDFVWLGDVAAAVDGLLARPDCAGRVFNISSGAPVSIGEVASRAAKVASQFLGREVPLVLEHGGTSPSNDPSGNTVSSLQVENSAVCDTLGISFHERMEDEMLAIFQYLAQHGAA